MKLNRNQRLTLGEKLLDLANLLAASYVVGDFMSPKDYSAWKAVVVAVAVLALYRASLHVMPRFVESKDE